MNRSSAAGLAERALAASRSVGIGWLEISLIELLAQNDQVLAIAGQELLVGISRVPNPRLRHEIEAGAMNHRGPVPLRVGSEEDRRAEDALERSDQASVLGTALLDAECIEHLGGTVEGDPGGLLPNCHRRQEDRNQPILSPRESIARVTGDLKHEASVPPFVKEASGWRTLHREPTEYKRPR